MRTRVVISFALCLWAAMQAFQPTTRAAARAQFDYYLTGNAADIKATTTPGLMLRANTRTKTTV
jgi:hypothetical protein